MLLANAGARTPPRKEGEITGPSVHAGEVCPQYQGLHPTDLATAA